MFTLLIKAFSRLTRFFLFFALYPNVTCKCSAYTHVFADTLRSIAVIIATIIALIVKSVTPEEADASAAVVVSILILLSLIPLFQGLKQSLEEFFAIRAEEQSEQMFASSCQKSNSAAAVSSANNEVV
jgi:Co/Zn/Cd efflux system component